MAIKTIKRRWKKIKRSEKYYKLHKNSFISLFFFFFKLFKSFHYLKRHFVLIALTKTVFTPPKLSHFIFKTFNPNFLLSYAMLRTILLKSSISSVSFNNKAAIGPLLENSNQILSQLELFLLKMALYQEIWN